MSSVPRIARAAAALGLALACLVPRLQATPEPSPSFTTAKATAAREGKLLLVEFTATWCAPCRLLAETTLVDPAVVAYLGEHYVTVAVDVDDFDGIALKQAFGVESLPTLVFLASDGEEVGRVAEGVGATRLLELLAEYNVPANRATVTQRPSGPPPEHAAASEYASPAAPPAPMLARADDPAAAAAPRAGRPRVLSLAVGTYADREAAVAAAERLRERAGEAVLLEFAVEGEWRGYRLYVGRFADAAAAAQLSARLEAEGLTVEPRELPVW